MNCSACMTSNPPWAAECAECGAELARGDWRPPTWLSSQSGDEPVIFALRRRRRRRQWYALGLLVLLIGGAVYARVVRSWLAEPADGGIHGPPPTRVAYTPESELNGGLTDGVESVVESTAVESAFGVESVVPAEAYGSGEGAGDGTATAPKGSKTGTRLASGGKTTGARGHGAGGGSHRGGGGSSGSGGATPDRGDMVRVAAGSFLMGSASGDDAEKPAHEVKLGAFLIDRCEVTNEQYKRFVDATGHAVPYASEPWASEFSWDRAKRTYPAGKGNWPVVLVSWSDAVAYARWAGKRLPTEAEWEYAARGPQGATWPWGSAWDGARANADGADGFTGLAPVGSLAQGASWCGAVDLAGNVWEWCSDWFAPDFYAKSPASDPTGPPSGRYRVLRGGSFASGSELCRATARLFRVPNARSEAAGFRCVADL